MVHKQNRTTYLTKTSAVFSGIFEERRMKRSVKRFFAGWLEHSPSFHSILNLRAGTWDRSANVRKRENTYIVRTYRAMEGPGKHQGLEDAQRRGDGKDEHPVPTIRVVCTRTKQELLTLQQRTGQEIDKGK